MNMYIYIYIRIMHMIIYCNLLQYTHQQNVTLKSVLIMFKFFTRYPRLAMTRATEDAFLSDRFQYGSHEKNVFLGPQVIKTV